MDQATRASFSPAIRAEAFRWLGVPPDRPRDLGGFENLVYGCEGRVIRATHVGHRSESQLLGELEFVQFLADAGASVARPLSLPDGSLVRRFDDFFVTLFAEAPGQPVSGAPISASLARAWGGAIGTFHRIAATYRPQHPRQHWNEDPNHAFARRIPADQTQVLLRGEQLFSELHALPQTPDVYGLIHSDAHTGNFLIDGERLTFFDFDDCLHAWFGYDLATILFGVVLAEGVALEDRAQCEAARRFLVPFLEGYAPEAPLAGLLLEHLAPLLRLRELSLYAVIHAFLDPADPGDGFAARFMQDRRLRIEAGRPFLEMDFAAFSA